MTSSLQAGAGKPAIGAERVHEKSRRTASIARRPLSGVLFVAPVAIVVIGLFLIPVGILVAMSFMDWPLFGPRRAAGISNYTGIASNALFLGAISFTLLYTLVVTIVSFLVAFGLVAISNSDRKGARVYRTIYFLPYVVGMAAASLMWFINFDDLIGVYNAILMKVGLTNQPVGFLSTPAKAFISTVVLVVWKLVGFKILVLLVGLQGIPEEVYEASQLDGASRWQTLRYITFPYLRPTLGVLLILSVTNSLLAFDQFLILTKGGPNNSTVTLVYAIYNTAFESFDLGRAAALAIVLLFALLLINGAQALLLRRQDG